MCNGEWGAWFMAVELKIYLVDAQEFADLEEWMRGHPGVAVTAVARPGAGNAQGSVWDFLSIACATGGPVALAVRALQLWIESRITTVQIAIGDDKSMITVKTRDAATVLPQVEKIATKIALAGDTRRDDPA